MTDWVLDLLRTMLILEVIIFLKTYIPELIERIKNESDN